MEPAKIGAYANDELCIALLHAAAFDTTISNVILEGSLVSFRNVANTRLFNIGVVKREQGDTHYPSEINFSWGIAGVLKGYDLPDLDALIAPRKLAFINSKNAAFENIPAEVEADELSFPRAVFAQKNKTSNILSVRGESKLGSVIDWSFKN